MAVRPTEPSICDFEIVSTQVTSHAIDYPPPERAQRQSVRPTVVNGAVRPTVVNGAVRRRSSMVPSVRLVVNGAVRPTVVNSAVRPTKPPICDFEIVSTQVTSHAIDCPFLKGPSVSPSGRLPLTRSRRLDLARVYRLANYG
ncbi:hypothetical protein BV898_17783 [Hypsibius exemplaris]|uniref:Uncharacterized protein n=1 Tax=Hypsibius exemplaris TaxID=2072580 RepID=A0A9X6NG87_HYPEX|nr:hypothetical protein BV898_17783 [Hypsibius exemplaris]